VIDAKHGVAAFVTREQIDHKNGRGFLGQPDRQFQQVLYAIKAGDSSCRRISEEHAYEAQGGNRFIKISELRVKEITFHTQDGEQKMAI
jgi:hypothetical protein